MDWNALFNSLIAWGTNVGVKIIIALLLMFVSFKLINFICRRIEKKGEKKDVKSSIRRLW